MKKIFLEFVIVFLVVVPALLLATAVPVNASKPILSIKEIKVLKPTSGKKFYIAGFVVAKSECSCPKNALCEPCAPHHIIVSDDPKAFKSAYPLRSSDLILRVDSPDDFKLRKKYNFLIEVMEEKMFGNGFNDCKIIDFQEVK